MRDILKDWMLDGAEAVQKIELLFTKIWKQFQGKNQKIYCLTKFTMPIRHPYES